MNLSDGVQLDYMIPAKGVVSNGLFAGSRNIGAMLLNNGMDIGCLRPYVGEDGNSYITRQMVVNTKDGPCVQAVPQRMVYNDATLPYLAWEQIDNEVSEIARARMPLVNLLRSKGLVYRLPNGIAKTTLKTQRMGDFGPATVSMDALRRGESDRPVFDTIDFPLPIIHKDFQFSLRELLESRTSAVALDTASARLSARKVGEQCEQLLLGTTNSAFGVGQAASYGYNGAVLQGLLNWTGRMTTSITLPTAGGWTPDVTVNDVLRMRGLLQDAHNYGPWLIIVGLDWDEYLDDDYKPTYNDTTLRTRLKAIKGITDVVTADYMPGLPLIMVNLESETIRLVIGMDVITLQWSTEGGLQENFKIMCMILPQLRGDYNGNTGIIVGS